MNPYLQVVIMRKDLSPFINFGSQLTTQDYCPPWFLWFIARIYAKTLNLNGTKCKRMDLCRKLNARSWTQEHVSHSFSFWVPKSPNDVSDVKPCWSKEATSMAKSPPCWTFSNCNPKSFNFSKLLLVTSWTIWRVVSHFCRSLIAWSRLISLANHKKFSLLDSSNNSSFFEFKTLNYLDIYKYNFFLVCKISFVFSISKMDQWGRKMAFNNWNKVFSPGKALLADDIPYKVFFPILSILGKNTWLEMEIETKKRQKCCHVCS